MMIIIFFFSFFVNNMRRSLSARWRFLDVVPGTALEIASLVDLVAEMFFPINLLRSVATQLERFSKIGVVFVETKSREDDGSSITCTKEEVEETKLID